MHEKIKHIIAASLVIGAISGGMVTDTFGFGTVKAYASTYTNANNGQLTSLALTWDNGKEIELQDSYSGDKVDLSEKSDYYVELKSLNGFNISAEVKGSGYVVKQFTSSSKTVKGKDVGDYINIDSTYTSVYLRTYKSEEAYKEAYENGNVSNCEKTYIIHARKATVSSEKEQDREYAYLENIHLSDGNITFSKKNTSYDVNIDEALDKILVRATPEDDEDSVEINGYYVSKDDNFEKTINLDKGNNTISIYVEHDDEDETYTLNLIRGKASDQTTTDNINFTIQSAANKVNAWQEKDGKWRYINGTGEVLKNQFWFDKSTGMNYYLKEDGSRATGWFNDNNNWYYFSENGQMKTGWVNLNKNWYYLNENGIMKMGWLEDSAGNSYYLDNNGAMKVGWIENSDGKWYYLDSTGKMIKNANISGDTVGADGAWIK